MTSVALPSSRHEAVDLYLVLACVCALIAFVGFTPTYWAPWAGGRFAGPQILHLHGLLFSAWMVYFVLQTTWVATGRVGRHRSLGLLGIALTVAMVFVGIMAALHSIRLGATLGLEAQNRAFSIVPISTVLFFAGTVAVAVANVTRPDVHRRLMLLATISILPPAFARLLALAAGIPFAPGHPPPIAFSLVPSFASDLLLVVAMVWDRRREGRFHRSYLVAGAGLLAVQILRVPLGPTPAWHAFTDWLLAFGA